MKRQNRKPTAAAALAALAALLAALAPGAAPAQVLTTTALQATYAEGAKPWTGPATAKMVMEGYPSPPGPCAKDQDKIAQAIELANPEGGWHSSPEGLKAAMTALCPPSGSWIVEAQSDQAAVMYRVARLMRKFRYPVAALLDTPPVGSEDQDHWVAIQGIQTDKDPTVETAVQLQFVFYADPDVKWGTEIPKPPSILMVNGSIWNSRFKAVAKPGSTHDKKFVAVIEPPEGEGRAVAGPRVLTGVPLPAQEALRRAVAALPALPLERVPGLDEIRRARPLTPLLVNRERGGYFLVPFSTDGRLARFALLLNAYTGEVEEVGAVPPGRWLKAQEVMPRISAKLGRTARGAAPALVSAIDARNRFRPTWKVEEAGRAIHVDLEGKEVRQEVSPAGPP